MPIPTRTPMIVAPPSPEENVAHIEITLPITPRLVKATTTNRAQFFIFHKPQATAKPNPPSASMNKNMSAPPPPPKSDINTKPAMIIKRPPMPCNRA